MRDIRRTRALAFSLALAPLLAIAAEPTCGPYPALPVKSPAGYCVAVVADARSGLRFPRAVLVTGDDEVLVNFQWTDAQGKSHLGAPVGLDEDKQGSLWIADDHNRLLLKLMKNQAL